MLHLPPKQMLLSSLYSSYHWICCWLCYCFSLLESWPCFRWQWYGVRCQHHYWPTWEANLGFFLSKVHEWSSLKTSGRILAHLIICVHSWQFVYILQAWPSSRHFCVGCQNFFLPSVIEIIHVFFFICCYFFHVCSFFYCYGSLILGKAFAQLILYTISWANAFQETSCTWM